MYRPPLSKGNSLTVSTFLDEFQGLLDSLISNSEDLTVIGDLNFHFDALDHPGVRQVETLLSDRNLRQLIQSPTHRKGHTLDVLITDSDNCPEGINFVDNLLSDHKTVYFLLNFSGGERKRRTVETRNLRQIETLDFSSDLKTACETILHSSDRPTDELVNDYNSSIKTVLATHASVTVTRVSERDPAPWIGVEERKSRVQRRKAEEQWRAFWLHVHREIFQQKRRDTKDTFELAKKKYFEDKFECCANSKQLFQVIDDVQGKEKNKVLPYCTEERKLPQFFF